jgi:antitoxin VapB
LPDNKKLRKARTLYIKNPAAHRLAEHLSKRMGVTLTDAVIHALEEQARRAGQAIDREKIDALCARMQALPVLDPRTQDEILGYDDFGIPR